MKNTILYKLLTYLLDKIGVVAIICIAIGITSFWLIPISKDKDFNINSGWIVFIIAIFAFLVLLMFYLIYISGKEESKMRNNLKSARYLGQNLAATINELEFEMDGRTFTAQDAEAYFLEQKDRGRTAFRLIVKYKNSPVNEFDGFAADYFKNTKS